MRGSVWSCGGGTQSAAIAALIVSGDLPAPDLAVIADTGREASETWTFYEQHLKPALSSVGVDLVRLPHSFKGDGYNTVDIYSGKDKDTIVIPMFTSQDGQGMLPKYCSNEWKRRPVDRFIREQGFTHGEVWIGFSTDETQRMRGYDPAAKWNDSYPLIDRRLSRGDCIALAERTFSEKPPRSACYMCPYRSDQEWLHLKRHSPKDFRAAVRLERKLQERDPNVYFHDSCRPLDTIEFNESQADMFDLPCASGMCFT